MRIRTLKDEVLEYIEMNNAKCTLADIHIYFLNENGSLTVSSNINDITQAVKELIEAGSVTLNSNSTLQINEPDKVKEEQTSSEDLKEEILSYIKANNGVYFVSDIVGQFSNSLRNKNTDATPIINSVIHELFKEQKIEHNSSAKLCIIEHPEIKPMNNENQIEVEVCKSALLEEEKQTNDIYTLTPNQNMFLKNILEMIKVYFKNSFGIDLTSEQAFDRMAVLFNSQMIQNPFSIVTPIPTSSNYNQNSFPPNRNNQPVRSVGETECRVFTSPAGNIARYSEFQDNTQAMRKGLEEAGLSNRGPLNFPAPPFVGPNPPKGMREVRTTPDNKDRHDAFFQCPEGPFARMYPGFRNMILPQREELPKVSKKPVTKRKPKK